MSVHQQIYQTKLEPIHTCSTCLQIPLLTSAPPNTRTLNSGTNSKMTGQSSLRRDLAAGRKKFLKGSGDESKRHAHALVTRPPQTPEKFTGSDEESSCSVFPVSSQVCLFREHPSLGAYCHGVGLSRSGKVSGRPVRTSSRFLYSPFYSVSRRSCVWLKQSPPPTSKSKRRLGTGHLAITNTFGHISSPDR